MPSKKSSTKQEDYILGTDTQELHRLGIQHQVWSSEARRGWEIGEFNAGQTILDLGCGPGFCTTELAYIAGKEGRVIGVDKSKTYLQFLERLAKIYQLNIETVEADFLNMELEAESVDAVYARWALAWDADIAAVIAKVVEAMRPGASIVSHEYYDWSTFQSSPELPALKKGIATILHHFKNSGGQINIGKSLPQLFYDAGLEVISTRPMAKLATPESSTWQWPKSFLNIYLPKLFGTGAITEEEVNAALGELEELEYIDGATIFTPQMVEVVAVKV